jgi:hypothetical protein
MIEAVGSTEEDLRTLPLKDLNLADHRIFLGQAK